MNGNQLWLEAIQKEMDQLKKCKTFRIPKEGDDLSTYQQIPSHMVLDCKFDGRRKGRLVAGGNHTVFTSEQVYSDRGHHTRLICDGILPQGIRS
jgi:hypothetical protein